MKMSLISDLHLGKKPGMRIDDFEKTQTDKLRFLFEKSEDVLIIAGDIFHTPKELKYLVLFYELCQEFKNKQIFCVAGQHDMVGRNIVKESSYSFLGFLPNVVLLENNKPYFLPDDNSVETDDVLIQGVNWGDNFENCSEFEYFNILLIHESISDSAMPFQTLNALEFLQKHQNYDLIVCGDIHRRFIVRDGDRVIINSGPLLRRELNKYNLTYEPAFINFDTETRESEIVYIPCQNSSTVFDLIEKEESGLDSEFLRGFIDLLENVQNTTFDFTERLKRSLAQMPKNDKVYEFLNKHFNLEEVK